MQHTLKTDSDVFWQVVKGEKKFEIRINDRDFKIGDTLELKETEFTGEAMKDGAPYLWTGHVHKVVVTSILHGPKYGLKDGWCIMSIIPKTK